MRGVNIPQPAAQRAEGTQERPAQQSDVPKVPELREIVVQAEEISVTEELQIRETNQLEDLL